MSDHPSGIFDKHDATRRKLFPRTPSSELCYVNPTALLAGKASASTFQIATSRESGCKLSHLRWYKISVGSSKRSFGGIQIGNPGSVGFNGSRLRHSARRPKGN